MAVVALTMEASLDEEAAGAGATGATGASVVSTGVESTPETEDTVADRDEPALVRAEFSADWKVEAKPAPLMVEVAAAAALALVKPSSYAWVMATSEAARARREDAAAKGEIEMSSNRNVLIEVNNS